MPLAMPGIPEKTCITRRRMWEPQVGVPAFPRGPVRLSMEWCCCSSMDMHDGRIPEGVRDRRAGTMSGALSGKPKKLKF